MALLVLLQGVVRQVREEVRVTVDVVSSSQQDEVPPPPATSSMMAMHSSKVS